MAENDKYKLVTRRVIAWAIVAVVLAVIAFTGIWGAINDKTEYVTLAIGILSNALGVVIGFYFGKKVSEE